MLACDRGVAHPLGLFERVDIANETLLGELVASTGD